MGRWVLLVTLVGCSFRGAALGQAGSDGGLHDSSSNGNSDAGNDAAIVDGSNDAAIVDGPVGTVTAAFQATANAKASTTSSLSWTHTATGINRLVVVGVSQTNSNASITSVTYGGTAMTLVGTRTNTTKNISISMFRLVAPPTGPQTVLVSFGSSVDVVAASTSFTSVDQVTPTGTFASAVGGGPSLAINVASAPTDIVIDTLVTDTNPSSVTAGTGQMQRWNSAQNLWAAGSTKPGASSVTMGWMENGGNDDWAMGAVSIRGG